MFASGISSAYYTPDDPHPVAYAPPYTYVLVLFFVCPSNFLNRNVYPPPEHSLPYISQVEGLDILVLLPRTCAGDPVAVL